ncbi:hypothetical protein [Cecembia sp.]|uniref:hypothetical protein n=1 Tax=Cecembia sp. TaxID=1898110 RepID=UPI0025C59D9D|nr:hypothetical protein [Cecembia sp.]
MKNLVFIVVLFALPYVQVFGQTDKQMIDVEYDFFGSINSYSVSGKTLHYKDLKAIFENYPEPKVHMDKAIKRKNIATPLLAIGGAGLITSFIVRTTDAGPAVFWSSFGVFAVGASYHQGYRVNLQRAVNTYNKNLFESTRVRSSLDLKLSPLQTGLIYSF